MACLATPVARLACGVQGAAVGRGAVAGDVSCFHLLAKLLFKFRRHPPSRRTGRKRTQFPARIALHSLGLAVAGEMVRPAALVARRWARTACEAAPEAAAESTTRRSAGAAAAAHARVGAVARKVAGEAATVAASAGAGAAEAEGRAVGLHVAEALAVVALLGWGVSVVMSLKEFYCGG